MTCNCNCNSVASPKKVATLNLTAEFDIDDGLFLPDILDNIRNAVDELRANGHVKSAILTMPASELDLTS